MLFQTRHIRRAHRVLQETLIVTPTARNVDGVDLGSFAIELNHVTSLNILVRHFLFSIFLLMHVHMWYGLSNSTLNVTVLL